MEQLNRIELRGIVGMCHTQLIIDTIVAHFSMATNYVHKDKDGAIVVETTWHNVTAIEKKDAPIFDLQHLGKGDAVHVIGRLRMQNYTANDGSEKVVVDIVASHISKIVDDGPMKYETDKTL